MTARWSLVSTMHGLPETILPCVAHHLQTDAEKLYIYLDAPNPPVEAALADHPRCIVTVCDDDYWAARPKGRPAGVVRRQLVNLRHAKRRAESDWLVHVDSDEFLVPTDPATPFSLSRELALVPSHHDWARIAPMERVLLPGQDQQTIFDGVFRAQTEDRVLIAAAYRDAAMFLQNGLSGHSRGKIAFRRTTQLALGLHDLSARKGPEATDESAPEDLPPFTALKATRLLHFEGWTALHWTSKLLRFVEAGRTTGHNRGRRAAVNFMATEPDGHARLALFDRVQRLSETGLDLLSREGVLRTAPFAVAGQVIETFPKVALNFSAAAFDAHLRLADADFMQRNGL
ncbi:glycosyltransferase family 2 protein [Paragemmobacter ruber]|uniref:Glycosyl transferase family 2 n=1 Tax=Paragemmobacter ruber TaxID=1985673 RepID=A0ABW9Y1P5_9RHOB|nr:glycosyltransferase family 2 protein [Rhodobacter ruber]NBE06433.1 hypothetical protein [Rhodobacter ruber]